MNSEKLNDVPNTNDNYKLSDIVAVKEETKENNTEKIDKKDFQIYKYNNNIPLSEAILINNLPYFLQAIDGKVEIKEKIELDDFILVPPNKINYLSKDYSFSSVEEISSYYDRAKNESLDSLYRKVKSVWKKYLDIDDDSLILCTADTIFTYFQDKLGITHYLLFVGDNNSGKSNALRILENLAYRPMFDTSITPANIYNFLDKIEEGQGIILEDEIDSIEEQPEKMKIYKAGYISGTKVTRIYESSNSNKSSKRPQRYFTFSFKAFSSEKYPSFFKAKGFNERLLTIKCSPGNPQYDITEVINDAGDPKYKKLYNELKDLRKLLLIFRILNYDKPISDIEVSLTNRDKQLSKPLIRLFQDNKCVKEISNSLSHFISEKKNKKLNTLDSYLFSIITDLTKNGNYAIPNEILWNMVLQLAGDKIPFKPHSYQTDEFGLVSKYQVTKTCEDKFGAHRGHNGEQRTLIFNSNTLRKLESNYSSLQEIKIFSATRTNIFNTFNTFWNTIENNGNIKLKKLVTNDVETDKTPVNTLQAESSTLMISGIRPSITSAKFRPDVDNVLDASDVLNHDRSNNETDNENDYVIYINNNKKKRSTSNKILPNDFEDGKEVGYKKPYYFCKKHPHVENVHYDEIIDHIRRSELHKTLE